MSKRIVKRSVFLFVLFLSVLSTNVEGSFPDSPHSSGQLRLGVNMHPLQGTYAPALVTQQIALARKIGASIVRFDIHWAWIEPSGPGVDDWNRNQINRLTAFLDGLSGTDIQVLAVVTETPCWASSDPNKDCRLPYQWRRYPHANPQDYAKFLGELVSRYGNRIKYWEIWNEPNLPYFWENSYHLPYTPAMYTTLLKTVYPAIKAKDPSAVVIGGGLAPTENDSSTSSMSATAYLDEMYSSGVKGYFDKLSFHPYTDGNSPTWSDARWPMHSFSTSVPAIRQVMQNHNDTSAIWLTEVGWTTVPAASCTDCWTPTLPKTESEQSAFMVEAINMTNTWPFVEAFLWYELVDMIQPSDPLSVSFDQYFGLFRKDLTPKPASREFTNLAQPDETYLPFAQK